MRAIDLNADLGETVNGVPTADDAQMFPVISSASIACGGHAGDASSMRVAVALAVQSGVAVGAHPSYADRANFGRLAQTISPDELRAQVSHQLTSLMNAGADIRYVKPHGALYHAVTADAAQAAAVVAAVADLSARLGRPLPILGLPGEIDRAAIAADLPFVREAFLDRGYLPGGGLVPRDAPGALLRVPAVVAQRAITLVVDGVVDAVDGSQIETDAASLCLHGDTPDAVALARAVRAALDGAGIAVRANW